MYFVNDEKRISMRLGLLGIEQLGKKNISEKSIIIHVGGITEYDVKKSAQGDLGYPDGSIPIFFFFEILLKYFLKLSCMNIT